MKVARIVERCCRFTFLEFESADSLGQGLVVAVTSGETLNVERAKCGGSRAVLDEIRPVLVVSYELVTRS
jgi:hypothetical protein